MNVLLVELSWKTAEQLFGHLGRSDHRLLLPQDGAGLRKEQVWHSTDVAGN